MRYKPNLVRDDGQTTDIHYGWCQSIKDFIKIIIDIISS